MVERTPEVLTNDRSGGDRRVETDMHQKLGLVDLHGGYTGAGVHGSADEFFRPLPGQPAERQDDHVIW